MIVKERVKTKKPYLVIENETIYIIIFNSGAT